jgi:hypothetical protein
LKKSKRIKMILFPLLLCVIIIPSGSLITQSVHAQSNYTWDGCWSVAVYKNDQREEPPSMYVSFNLRQRGDQVVTAPLKRL